MDKNNKSLVVRLILFTICLYIPHFVKNIIVSMFHLEKLINMPANLRVFNKFVALEVLFFLLVLFVLYNRELLAKIQIPKLDVIHLILFTAISYVFVSYYYASQILVVHYQLFLGVVPILIVISQFIALGAYLIFAALAIFGMKIPKEIFKKTYPQVYYFAAGEVILTAAMIFFQKAWPFFSFNVSKALYFMLSKFYFVDSFMMAGTPILAVNDFAVSIGAPCSGIDSMLLFTAFFAGIFALDYKKLKVGRYILFFIIGFIGVIFVNILRLFILIVLGVEFSPEFAVGMFHTNAGWVLFILYFLGYYYIIKKHVYLDP